MWKNVFSSSRNVLFLHCRNQNHRGAESDLLSVRFSPCHHRTTMKLYGFIFEVLGSCHWVEVIEQHGNTDCVCVLYKLVSKYFNISAVMSWWREKGLENENKLRLRGNVDVCCLATPIEVSKIELVLCGKYGNTFERREWKSIFNMKFQLTSLVQQSDGRQQFQWNFHFSSHKTLWC